MPWRNQDYFSVGQGISRIFRQVLYTVELLRQNLKNLIWCSYMVFFLPGLRIFPFNSGFYHREVPFSIKKITVSHTRKKKAYKFEKPLWIPFNNFLTNYLLLIDIYLKIIMVNFSFIIIIFLILYLFYPLFTFSQICIMYLHFSIFNQTILFLVHIQVTQVIHIISRWQHLFFRDHFKKQVLTY